MQGNRTGDDTSGVEWERTRKNGHQHAGLSDAAAGDVLRADADCVGITEHIDWNKNRQWMEVLAESGTPFFCIGKTGISERESEGRVKRSIPEGITAAPGSSAAGLDGDKNA